MIHSTVNPSTRIAWKIRDIQHRHLMMIRGILDRYGLHFGQPRILHTMLDMNGASQKEISEKLQISQASLAMSVKRMQKAGFLEKITDQNDLRVNQIRVTAKGMQVHKDSLAEVTASDHQMLDGFSAEEIAQLDNYLERILQNLNQIKEPSSC